MRYLSLEFFKMRRRGIFLTILALVAVGLAWCTLPLKRQLVPMAADPSAASWESLLLSATMIKGLIFSIVIAVTVCRVNDTEYKGNTWKLLESSAQTRDSIWTVKFLSVFLLIALAQVLEGVYLLVYGAALHLAEPFPLPAFLNCFFGSLTVSAAIILLQQWISMTVENQLVAMAVGILGSFVGLFGMFFPANLRWPFIWTYYIALSPASYNDAGEIVRLPLSAVPILVALAAAVLLFFLGRRQFAKTES